MDGRLIGFVVSGRRQTIHRSVAAGSAVTVGTVRCRIDFDDEEWAPRPMDADEVAKMDPRRLCGWCFPSQKGDRP